MAGWVLAFARGVGEFGATIVFAGNVQGEHADAHARRSTTSSTRTSTWRSSIGILLVVLSGAVLLSYKLLVSWRTLDARHRLRPSRTSTLDVALERRRGETRRARRPVRARARRRCCARSPGSARPTAGASRSARRLVRRASGASTCAPEQRSVGLVFQEYALFPHMSVRQNVAFGGGRARRRAARPLRHRPPRGVRPAAHLRRGAPARRARARPRARARGAAVRRAARRRSTRTRARSSAPSSRTCSPIWASRR